MEKKASPLSPLSLPAVSNAGLFDGLYGKWKKDPRAVGEDWRLFFAGFDLAMCPQACVSAERARAQSRVASLIYAYRSLGHLVAELDPLGNNPTRHEALELETFGLTGEDLDRIFDTGHLGGPQRATLREIIAHLKATYCGSIGVEYIHIQDKAIRRWLQARMEPIRNRPSFTRERKLEILEMLIDAEVFETFLQGRYPGQKRFSLEGAEAVIAALHELVHLAPELGVEEVVMGMAHRGRLNVLANILEKSYARIFSEFEGGFLPETVGGGGDVKYHLGYDSDHVGRDGRSIHISLTANPSHLEAVDPVVEGRARAKQRQQGDEAERSRVLPLLIHGDAAFAGQGLVAETLNLSQLEGYRTGGTLHFVINNQIGFTTMPAESRSSFYSTDTAKMIEAPIFHVNGDDPEALVHATELALRFRQEFHRDVVVDMICYRRHGHNEGDEPAFTQPLLYRKIKDRLSVRKIYTLQLVARADITPGESEAISEGFKKKLDEAFRRAREEKPPMEVHAFEGRWAGLDGPFTFAPADTAAGREDLLRVARALTAVPEGFRLNPKVARLLPERRRAVEEGGNVDWAFAELLAFGTLLVEGIPVRLSGQDSRRGTFSQRHAVWYDMETQEAYTPLDHIGPDQARFCVYNSSLAEASVLGFDYGYSLAEPRMLVLWEAQFGDFANGAQVIIDQFVVSSLSKWQRASGIVMLLPHGYEGQGPDHSNAYLERYLQAAAGDNIQVANVTTPAQYFHLLRRQMKRNFRRPLIVMTPKSLLRRREAVSPAAELAEGRFREILDDPAPPKRPRRLVLSSGKVYYDLAARRGREEGGAEAALVRVEQIHPFHEEEMKRIARRYGGVEEVVWAQEEPENRGAWTYIAPLLARVFGGREIRYAGRPAAASPATGSYLLHKKEQESLVASALGLDGGEGGGSLS